MAKLYQRIEQIFRFRLLANTDIAEYLKRMSRMGKIDDVKKAELFNLILTKLGEIEDQESLPPTQEVPLPPTIVLPPDDNKTIAYPCPDCDMVAKSELGLISHSRKHKKTV